jgi:hypothetical protein
MAALIETPLMPIGPMRLFLLALAFSLSFAAAAQADDYAGAISAC